jgi:hypothetical protein
LIRNSLPGWQDAVTRRTAIPRAVMPWIIIRSFLIDIQIYSCNRASRSDPPPSLYGTHVDGSKRN